MMPGDEPWGYDGPPSDIAAHNWGAQMGHVPLNRDKPKRSGKTPEAKVLAACIKYLELLDCYVLRTSAGFTQFDGRKMAIGRKGGHDLTVCKLGKFISIEVKSETGTASPDQLRQRDFIERRGGIVIIPHSVAELRAGLVAAFGEQTVSDWEKLGAARRRR